MKITSAQSILIIGGGPTGVELAGKIAGDFPKKKITLVQSGSRLLEFLGSKASEKTMKWLISKNVEVKLEQTVNSDSVSDGNNVYQTSTGETIKADCHFLCTGKPVGSARLKETMLKNDLDKYGRIKVDEFLKVKGRLNIFAIGEAAAVPEMKKGYLAQKQALSGDEEHQFTYGWTKRKRVGTLCAAVRDGHCFTWKKRCSGTVPICNSNWKNTRFNLLKSGDLFVGKTRKQMGLPST